MSLNRRRHINAVPLASIATWILVATFAGSTGLIYVYYKNQLHISGATIKRLEREHETVRREIEGARTRIGKLSATRNLQLRLDEGFIKLVPITDDKIVRVEARGAAPQEELRAVANERGGE